jgi:hypothetical protein
MALTDLIVVALQKILLGFFESNNFCLAPACNKA